MKSQLSPRRVERLVGVLEMLSSDFAGERDAAALAATRMVRDAGLRWVDLLHPPKGQGSASSRGQADNPPDRADWRATCAWCAARGECLNRWERDFVGRLPGFRKPSPRQLHTLTSIADRIRSGAR